METESPININNMKTIPCTLEHNNSTPAFSPEVDAGFSGAHEHKRKILNFKE